MVAPVSSVSLVPHEGASLADIDLLLTDGLGCVRIAAGRLSRVFYDTFDHRLHRAGLVLEHEWLDGRRWLRLRRIGEAVALVQAAADTAPARAEELTDRRLRAALVPRCGGRTLLPVVAADGEQYRYARIDDRDKTIVRVSVVTAVAAAAAAFTDGPPADPGTARHVLDPVVTLVAVRGHDAAFAELCDAVYARIGRRSAIDPLRRAAAAADIPLGIDPSDRAVPLRADQPAAAAAADLLARAADVLAANTAGIEADGDDEFLHQFRVTLRATRALVRVAGGVVAPEDRDALLKQLRSLMELTSPVRDLDVLRERWRHDEVLAPVLGVLAAERAASRAALLEALRNGSFEGLLHRLRAVRPAPGGSARTVADWAAAVLPGEQRRLCRRAGRALERTAAMPTAAVVLDADVSAQLHRARKQAKRLRYLLDAFGPLYGARLRPFRKGLKALQRELGRFQDDCVALDALGRATAGLAGAPPATLIELGRRSEQLRRDQTAAAAAFADAFAPVRRHRRRDAARLARPEGATP